MKKIVYKNLYSLLSAISGKINNRYINHCKIAVGTTLLLLTSGCQTPKKGNQTEDSKDSLYADSIENKQTIEADMLCYEPAINTDTTSVPPLPPTITLPPDALNDMNCYIIVEEDPIFAEDSIEIENPIIEGEPIVIIDPVVTCYLPIVVTDSILITATDENKIYEVTEQMPEFPGGTSELIKFLGKNVYYPETHVESNIKGRIIIRVIIEKDGSVTNPQILRGIDTEFDKMALEVVSKMPKFKPGIHNGEPVRVRYVFPISINPR